MSNRNYLWHKDKKKNNSVKNTTSFLNRMRIDIFIACLESIEKRSNYRNYRGTNAQPQKCGCADTET
jgi:hypothetical protein